MKVIPLKIKFVNYSNVHNAICFNFYNKDILILFVKNGKIHSSKYPAEIICTKYKEYYKYHGLFDRIYLRLEKSWRKQAKNIIRQHKLKVFQ